jgi:S-adenosylmethionine-diacylglycerol 3-amino-3-carboxypropyl transferase
MSERGVVYAQNWEDPRLELEALDVQHDDAVFAIAGGGCTALALLARAPRQLHVVDRNAAQIHLLHLKLAAVRTLAPCDAAPFLGGLPSASRREAFASIARNLPAATARYWQNREDQILRGVISQGRIERYFAALRWCLRAVHSARTTEELFAQPTIEAQRRFYFERWNTPAWRRAFLLGHKRILDRVLDASVYRHLEARNLPAELHGRAEHCLAEMPIAGNYFLSWILRGRYPDSPACHPPYLERDAHDALQRFGGRLETHTMDAAGFLRSRPDSSIDKFYLSNVPEWLTEDHIAPFFREVIRVARDGAVVCYRALMVDRALPPAIAAHLAEDTARSARLARRDRAFVNTAFHVATIRKTGDVHAGN